MGASDAIDRLFEGKTVSLRPTYDRLINELKQFGMLKESVKKTAIHLEKRSGFGIVHPRKDHLLLEFRTDYEIDDPRIMRTEKISSQRFEHSVKMENENDVDGQLISWLMDAYELSR